MHPNMEAVLSDAVNEVLRTRPNRPFKALAAHLKAADARLQGSDDDDGGESAARHADVPSHINTDGRRQKRFCELRAAVRSSRALLPPTPRSAPPPSSAAAAAAPIDALRCRPAGALTPG